MSTVISAIYQLSYIASRYNSASNKQIRLNTQTFGTEHTSYVISAISCLNVDSISISELVIALTPSIKLQSFNINKISPRSNLLLNDQLFVVTFSVSFFVRKINGILSKWMLAVTESFNCFAKLTSTKWIWRLYNTKLLINFSMFCLLFFSLVIHIRLTKMPRIYFSLF